MRIAVGSMMHETNTFTKFKTDITQFDVLSGDQVFEQARWMKKSSTGGIVETLQDNDIEVVPTCFGRALPSGIVEYSVYKTITEGILQGIKNAGNLDGVCLGLHGSMYVEGLDDPEGELLAEIRAIVGNNIPIVCALDMHATVTDKMIELADGYTSYRTAPHVDTYETGVRAANLLLSIINNDSSITKCCIKLPILLAGEQSETDVSPMKDLIEDLNIADSKEGILSACYLLGFPWADSPHNGVSAYVVGLEKNKREVKECANWLAEKFWERRSEFDFTTEAYPLDEAVSLALEDNRSPIIIADSGDNPTAGASEDLTYVVQYLLDNNIKKSLVAVIFDSSAVECCQSAGVGNEVTLDLGRIDTLANDQPLSITCDVKYLGEVNALECAVVKQNDVTIIISNRRTAVTDPEILYGLNVDPKDYKLIIVKSGYLSPQFQELASRKILALTPGDTDEILANLPYKIMPRPMYPIDLHTEWLSLNGGK